MFILVLIGSWTRGGAVLGSLTMAKGVTEAGIWALVDSCPRMETLRCFGIMDKGLLSVLCSRGIRHHGLDGQNVYFDLTQRHGMLLRNKSASAGGQACH